MYRALDDWIRDIDWIMEGKNANRYPLTDVVYNPDNGGLLIRIAVSGFDKDDIDVELVGNTLIINGEYPDKDRFKNYEFIQKNISEKDFIRKILLHQKYVGGDIQAEMNKGILEIYIKPKENPKKLIEIK